MKIEVLDEETNDDGKENGTAVVEDDQSRVPQQQQDQARWIVSSLDSDPSRTPDALYDLLVNVIKPLFSTTRHEGLTSTGRKNLNAGVTASSLGLSDVDSIFSPPPPWRNQWTTNLLSFILEKYQNIAEEDDDKSDDGRDRQKNTLESHFYLLIPPILNLIDDSNLSFKAEGCNLLGSLCALLKHNQSDMMKRTGLAEVFIDALKKNFTFLPTLTPEDDSLMLLKAMYPAYFALVQARFIALHNTVHTPGGVVDGDGDGDGDGRRNPTECRPSSTSATSRIQETPSKTKSHPSLSLSQISTETTLHTEQLTLLLRQSLLYSLSHLSTGSVMSSSTSSSPKLTAYLLSQLPILVSHMGIYTAPHLQTLLPLLKSILLDPFNTSYPEILSQSINAMQAIILTCWPRIVPAITAHEEEGEIAKNHPWWKDCLNAIVGCWLNIIDEEAEEEEGEPTRKREKRTDHERKFDKIKHGLKTCIKILEDLLLSSGEEGKEWNRTKQTLMEEDADDLQHLFM